MTIDWTQPIETTETPPRPVTVLFDANGEVYGVDIETNLWGLCSDRVYVCRRDDNGMGTHFITIRNVAPPKPEPVLREAWVAWDSDGMETVWSSEKGAADRARHLRGVYTRAATMSDGSPVPGEDDYVGMTGKIAMLEQQLDGLKDEMERLTKANIRLLGEIGQMRPVVDAAVAWEAWYKRYFSTNIAAVTGLLEAVRAYQSTPKKTAEEAVANVTKVMGPVQHRGCSSCHFGVSGDCLSTNTAECNAPKFPYWEAKND
jgi:hypothetical protein